MPSWVPGPCVDHPKPKNHARPSTPECFCMGVALRGSSWCSWCCCPCIQVSSIPPCVVLDPARPGRRGLHACMMACGPSRTVHAVLRTTLFGARLSLEQANGFLFRCEAKRRLFPFSWISQQDSSGNACTRCARPSAISSTLFARSQAHDASMHTACEAHTCMHAHTTHTTHRTMHAWNMLQTNICRHACMPQCPGMHTDACMHTHTPTLCPADGTASGRSWVKLGFASMPALSGASVRGRRCPTK